MTLRQPPSRLPEQPSEPKVLDFDYTALNPETRIVIQQRTSEIKTLIQRAAQQYSGQFFKRFYKAFRAYASRIDLFFQS